MQGCLVDRHCRDTLQLSTAGILCAWALQEHVAIEHCSQAPAEGEHNKDLEISQPHCEGGEKQFPKPP